MSKSKTKTSVVDMIAAVASGAAYNLAMEAAAKQSPKVAENYLVLKSLVAGVVGSAAVYFSKSSTVKFAGAGLLGIAGASGASKVATMIGGGGPMNGRKRTQVLNGINSLLNAKKGIRQNSMPARPGITGGTGARPGNCAMPNYSAMAFSDTIYM